MKKWLIFLVVFVIAVILAILAGVSFYWILNRPVHVSRTSILELSIGGSLIETATENPLVKILEPDRPSLLDYWQMLGYAANDDRVKGVFLEIQPLSGSWAQVEELRRALEQFQVSGKPVHAFLAVDQVQESELFLASAADTITVNPDCSFLVNGLLAEITFYKRTLEKLGITPQFIQFKEYKSPEVYDRVEMSPEIREMLRSMLEDLQERFVRVVGEDRNTNTDTVQAFLDRGLSTPQNALEAGLIDRIGYREEVWEALEDAVSEESEKVKASDYLESTRGSYQTSSANKIALITATGIITSGKSDAFSETLGGSTLASHLREVRKDKQFKGVLLRVNSPGGSAVGSDMVWNEVRLLEEAGKPVVVSMSGVAGSGGYYISMGASRIVSHPSTITGSIGVIFGKFDVEALFNWLGMDVDRVKISPNADLFSPFTTLSEEQERLITAWIEEIYRNFVSKAAEGRGTSFEELEPRARGRIYTGAQALELNLVDALGGFETAVQQIREVLSLEEDAPIQLVQYPRPKTLWEIITSSGLVESRVRSLSVERWLREELQSLETPGPRLLMPDVEIH